MIGWVFGLVVGFGLGIDSFQGIFLQWGGDNFFQRLRLKGGVGDGLELLSFIDDFVVEFGEIFFVGITALSFELGVFVVNLFVGVGNPTQFF